VRTFLALAFIAAATAAGIYVANRPTIARGEVIAADLLAQFRTRGVKELSCDQEIHIGLDGAKFYCQMLATDGHRGILAVTLDREGQYRLVETETSAPDHRHAPTSADPWD
jgi:hypothetical protein